jgi:hypothetical protein
MLRKVVFREMQQGGGFAEGETTSEPRGSFISFVSMEASGGEFKTTFQTEQDLTIEQWL